MGVWDWTAQERRREKGIEKEEKGARGTGIRSGRKSSWVEKGKSKGRKWAYGTGQHKRDRRRKKRVGKEGKGAGLTGTGAGRESSWVEKGKAKWNEWICETGQRKRDRMRETGKEKDVGVEETRSWTGIRAGRKSSWVEKAKETERELTY